ncbi:MAG TPA: Rieske 2Fe-2S domain-containing protein [Symbiobacteriaceae bacterium]|jgi:arsenite oxidase small subunit|nr:Rieske 2Fe-2S domain-containing protein [Symbiobacteriaceae bacterium]
MTDPKRLHKDGAGDPVHREENRSVNRRGFLGLVTVMTAGMAAAAVPALALVGEPSGAGPGEADGGGSAGGGTQEPMVAICRMDEIPVGGVVNFAYPDAHSPALLVRMATGEMRAYNNKCTHLECPVYYVKGEDKLRCPCHEGEFDVASGKAVAGPPRRQLTGIRLSVADGTVYAVGRYGN